jgi:hypothetical protein
VSALCSIARFVVRFRVRQQFDFVYDEITRAERRLTPTDDAGPLHVQRRAQDAVRACGEAVMVEGAIRDWRNRSAGRIWGVLPYALADAVKSMLPRGRSSGCWWCDGSGWRRTPLPGSLCHHCGTPGAA